MLAAAAKLPPDEAAKLMSSVRRLERRAERRRVGGDGLRSRRSSEGESCEDLASSAGGDGPNGVEPLAESRRRSSDVTEAAPAVAKPKEVLGVPSAATRRRGGGRFLVAPLLALAPLALGLLHSSVAAPGASDFKSEVDITVADVAKPVETLSIAERRARELAFELAVEAATQRSAKQHMEQLAERLHAGHSFAAAPQSTIATPSAPTASTALAADPSVLEGPDRFALQQMFVDAGLSEERSQVLAGRFVSKSISAMALKAATPEELARLLATPTLGVSGKERLALLRAFRALR